jgi:starch phosphorylase
MMVYILWILHAIGQKLRSNIFQGAIFPILTDMQQAPAPSRDEKFRADFSYSREIPENLKPLENISWNYFWSWNTGGAELFRELDWALWEKCEQNPRLFLREIEELRLWQKSTDPDYIQKLAHFAGMQENYLGQSPEGRDRISADHPAAYFCAEYGVHNSLPNYSGGLGILAGDHLKSSSDMNVPLVAVGLLYRYGYFRQNLGHDGWQKEHYNDVFQSELALTPVLDPEDERVTVMIHIRGREVYAQAWMARVGRISLYLLDTNIEQNADPDDRLITGHLYGGDSETRIVQEKVLGIGGVRLLRKLDLDPAVFHLNEGHSAFLTLELAREFLGEHEDAGFPDAMAAVREKCVFTTHTPVAAGNDVFSPKQLKDCFDSNFLAALKLSEKEFFALGRIDPEDEHEHFGMTPLAIRMCRSANGVSRKHGEVSRELWHKMFPETTDAEAVPITHVTNGVHAPTWIAPVLKRLFEEHIGAGWTSVLRDREAWSGAIDAIPDLAVWNAHFTLKRLLVAFIRERIRSKDTGTQDTINERKDTRGLFSPDHLTIGFARRVAAYKRWDLILSDLPRLLKLVDNDERPVQFVFAGKAHPQDRTAKAILQRIMTINQNSNWQDRAVFIGDYDQEVARYLVQGVDVWMNVPRRPMEASGTSGEKAAMNGGLNFSILDGWWIEGYNGLNGFGIGPNEDSGDDDAVTDKRDAEAVYSVLENEIVPAYYTRDETGLRDAWVRRMKNALGTLTPQFCSDRMVQDYLEKIYR